MAQTLPNLPGWYSGFYCSIRIARFMSLVCNTSCGEVDQSIDCLQASPPFRQLFSLLRENVTHAHLQDVCAKEASAI